MSRPMNTRRLMASIAALGLVAAACGSVSEGVDTTTTAAEEVQTTVTDDATETTTTVAETSVPADPDQTVAVGDSVSVHYVGTLDSGEQFDSSRDRGQPLTFAVGSGQMIVGFDNAVQGMKVGEIKTVRLIPSEAYGEKDPAALIEVPVEQVPEGTQVGDTLVSAQGQSVTVVEIKDGIAIIDANHSLAGEFLTFEIEIISIDS